MGVFVTSKKGGYTDEAKLVAKNFRDNCNIILTDIESVEEDLKKINPSNMDSDKINDIIENIKIDLGGWREE